MRKFHGPVERVRYLLHQRYYWRRWLRRRQTLLLHNGTRVAYDDHAGHHLALTERALRFNIWGDESGYA